jgi:hypothetical protein
MSEPRVSMIREPDERAAPWVFAYLAAVLLWLAAIVWWVY